MKFIVSNMTCNHCEKRIREALKEIGVKRIKINLETKVVEIVLRKISKEIVKQAILDSGYSFKEIE